MRRIYCRPWCVVHDVGVQNLIAETGGTTPVTSVMVSDQNAWVYDVKVDGGDTEARSCLSLVDDWGSSW